MPELRVGRAAGPHKAEGLGFTTSFSQIAVVMDGHNSAAGCCLHIWFQVERKSNKPGKSLEREGGGGSRAARGWSIFSTMESSGAIYVISRQRARRPILISHSAGCHGGFAVAVPALW